MSVAWRKSRFINALRILLGLPAMPLFVSVEPSAVCQLRCPACPVGMGNSSIPSRTDRFTRVPYMSREVWRRVLDEIRPYACTVQFYFQGEPLLNRNLAQMIAEAHNEGLFTVVSTNAQAMTPRIAEALVSAGLNRIIVSMDGLTRESYGAYRTGGEVDLCIKALRWLREAKDRLHGKTIIELQCLRLRTNEHEWEQLKRRYKSMGADRLVFKTAQLYGYSAGHPLMPTDERYSRYRKEKDGLYHRKPLSKGCRRVRYGAVIATNGDVLPCCYDKNHVHAYGNIMTSSLRELFDSEQAKAFRRQADEEQPVICKECWR